MHTWKAYADDFDKWQCDYPKIKTVLVKLRRMVILSTTGKFQPQD